MVDAGERVYDYYLSPRNSEETFLAECGRDIDQDQ